MSFREGYPQKFRYHLSNNNLINNDGILRLLIGILIISIFFTGMFLIISPVQATTLLTSINYTGDEPPNPGITSGLSPVSKWGFDYNTTLPLNSTTPYQFELHPRFSFVGSFSTNPLPAEVSYYSDVTKTLEIARIYYLLVPTADLGGGYNIASSVLVGSILYWDTSFFDSQSPYGHFSAAFLNVNYNYISDGLHGNGIAKTAYVDTTFNVTTVRDEIGFSFTVGSPEAFLHPKNADRIFKLWVNNGSFIKDNSMFIILNKSSAQIGEPIHALGGFNSSSHDEPNIIIWVDSQGDPILHTDRPIAYFKYNSDTFTWQKYLNGVYTNVSSPYSIDDSFDTSYPQHYIYISAYQDDTQIGSAIAYIDITGNILKSLLTIKVTDSETSALLGNSQVSIEDITANYFVKNDTTSNGIYTIYLNNNRLYSITASHEEYINQTKSLTFVNDSTIIFPLEKQVSIPATNATLKFKVFSDSTFNNPISGALVKLHTGEIRYTNSAGYAEFNLSCTEIVNYEVSASGYTSYANTFDTSLICGSQYTIMIWLQSGGEVTPTPTIGECEGVSVNPIDNIRCIFRAMQIDQTLDGGILGLLLVIFISGGFLYLARDSEQSGFAALVGGAIGFIFATFLGLFPIWILIAMAIVFGIIYAKMRGE